MKKEPYAGRAPFQAGSDTSEAGADDIEPVKLDRRRQVLDYIESQGGATILEIVEGTGMAYGTVCGRQGELREMGLIVDSGKRRVNSTGSSAIVWVPGDGVPRPRQNPRLQELKRRVRELEERVEDLQRENQDLRDQLDRMGPQVPLFR